MLVRSAFLFGVALLAPALAAPAESRHSQLIEDVRVLSADDMQGREMGTPGAAKARAYLVERMRAIGLAPAYATLEQPFAGRQRDGKAYRGVNLIGRIPGTGNSDRVLVIGAHYDHLGVRDGQVHNGADDNASGVAAVLEIAATLMRQRPQHEVIIALWDGEEAGLVGAKAFVAAPPVARSRIVLNLNLDMISRNAKGELWLAGAGRYPFLKSHFERLARTAPVTLRLGHDRPSAKGVEDWTQGSDHAAFHDAGIPFAYLGVEDHADYHRPTDDFDRIQPDFFARSAATAVQAARLFDAELDAIARDAKRAR